MALLVSTLTRYKIEDIGGYPHYSSDLCIIDFETSSYYYADQGSPNVAEIDKIHTLTDMKIGEVEQLVSYNWRQMMEKKCWNRGVDDEDMRVFERNIHVDDTGTSKQIRAKIKHPKSTLRIAFLSIEEVEQLLKEMKEAKTILNPNCRND